MNKIYFAHPTSMYNTPLERAFEKLIAYRLVNGNAGLIENPNQPKHQVGYTEYAKRVKESGTNHKGMSYFYDEVLPGCSGCVGVPFLDGRLGLGVAGEMKWFLERDKSVWLIGFSLPVGLNKSPVESFINNPLAGVFYIRMLIRRDIEQLLSGDPQLVIPHEETRLRSWKVYNRVVRPYEEAHMVKMPIPDGFYPEG